MKQVSDNFISKMQDTLRSWIPRMTINGTEVSGDIQTGLTINLGSCGAEEFNIGTVFIPSITATISDCRTVLQNKEIKLEMGLVLDDEIEYVPVGYFTVEKPNKGKFATSFTAYGRLMSKMGGMYESTLTYPTAIESVLSEISTQTGVTIKLNGLSGTSSVPLKPTGLNYREAIQLMAGLLGGFVTENSSGEVVICKYRLNDALTVDTSFCYEYPFVHDETYVVTGLSVKTDNAEYSYGTPNISIANGYMSEALFEVCKNNIMGFSYMPGSVHFLGDIRLDPWDSLNVTDDDATYQIPCMNIVHVWDGGLITTVNAPGTTEAEDGSGFEGSLKIIENKIVGIDGVTSAIETLFEIDKIKGTIKLQAGKLLEILSGGKLIVNAENYKLNEDGTVTITGGSIGGFKVNTHQLKSINGNIVINDDGSFVLGGVSYNKDTNVTEFDSSVVIGTDGEGNKKTLGKVMVGSDIKYGLSTSQSTCTVAESEWIGIVPDRTDGTYIWQRTAYYYADGSETIEDVCIQGADGKSGEDAILLQIDSSRGTVFKNNYVATILSVIIFKGSQRITDIDTLHDVFGSGAYIQWKWQRMDEESFGVISSTDSRLGNNGFTFTLSPDDVDAKVTFLCELIE